MKDKTEPAHAGKRVAGWFFLSSFSLLSLGKNFLFPLLHSGENFFSGRTKNFFGTFFSQSGMDERRSGRKISGQPGEEPRGKNPSILFRDKHFAGFERHAPAFREDFFQTALQRDG